MEKSHTGLDDCLRMLQARFRKRMSDSGRPRVGGFEAGEGGRGRQEEDGRGQARAVEEGGRGGAERGAGEGREGRGLRQAGGGEAGRRFNRKNDSGLSFGLKNGSRFHFGSVTCLSSGCQFN